MKIKKERDRYKKVPFDQRPVMVNGHRVTYGVIRLNAREMASDSTAEPWATGLAHSLLAVLDELEKCQEARNA